MIACFNLPARCFPYRLFRRAAFAAAPLFFAPASPYDKRVDCAEKPDRSFCEGPGRDFAGVWKMDGGYPALIYNGE